jgi:hypothetical protein
LWNVNKRKSYHLNLFVKELIETLWNVNYFIFGNFIKGDRGINRNIVECKLKMFATEGAKKFQN